LWVTRKRKREKLKANVPIYRRGGPSKKPFGQRPTSGPLDKIFIESTSLRGGGKEGRSARLLPWRKKEQSGELFSPDISTGPVFGVRGDEKGGEPISGFH